MRRLFWLPCLLVLVPSIAAGQGNSGPLSGTVYDSLRHTPLRGADVWLRGTARHVETDGNGRFTFDSVAPGRYTLLVSHPGLDSAGLFTLAVPLTVGADALRAPVRVATPSLATVWQRRCGQELMTRADSGVVFGVVGGADAGVGGPGAGARRRHHGDRGQRHVHHQQRHAGNAVGQRAGDRSWAQRASRGFASR